MVVAEETAGRTEGRRVRRRQHQMASLVNQLALSYRIGSPEDEHDILGFTRNGAYNLVGKLFPSVTAVGARLMCSHRKDGVEKENALSAPSRQVAVGGHRRREIGRDLLEYIDKRAGELDTRIHRKAHSVCLTLTVIGVLSEYNDLDIVEGT